MKRKTQAQDVPALFDLTPYTVDPAGEYIPDSSWKKFDSPLNDSAAIKVNDSAAQPNLGSEECRGESNLGSEECRGESNLGSEECRGESKSGWVSTYTAAGTARGKSEYYRYCWYRAGKLQQAHIRGGNTGNPIAQQRADKIRDAIARGEQPNEILQILKA